MDRIKKILNLYKSSTFAVIVALGIVYGDIGTSPLYVMKAIIANKIIDEFLILGSLSCIFWTLTLQTSVKYVAIALNADRKGHGGLLVLYSLIKSAFSFGSGTVAPIASLLSFETKPHGADMPLILLL